MIQNIKKVFYYSIVGVLLFYIVISFIFPSKTIDIFRFRTFIIVSSSMAPDIAVGDMILVTNTNESKLEAGDVITFEAYIKELNDYSFVTHYIARIDTNDMGETIYKTQGANREADDVDEWTDKFGEPVDITIDDIEGEYRFTVPAIGPLVVRLQDPIFLGIVLINGVILFALVKFIKDY